MALSKELVNEIGVTTTYHKVGLVDLRNNTLTCTIDSYVSKEYRDLERNADSTTLRFQISTEEEESMGIRQLCYAKIKTLEEWSDAVDC